MRRLIAWPAGLVALVLLAGCVSIPTGGGVTTARGRGRGPGEPAAQPAERPGGGREPEEIVAEFLRAGAVPRRTTRWRASS